MELTEQSGSRFHKKEIHSFQKHNPIEIERANEDIGPQFIEKFIDNKDIELKRR